MGFFDKLFGGKSKDENTAKFTNQRVTWTLSHWL